jgi:hypothetical protein
VNGEFQAMGMLELDPTDVPKAVERASVIGELFAREQIPTDRITAVALLFLVKTLLAATAVAKDGKCPNCREDAPLDVDKGHFLCAKCVKAFEEGGAEAAAARRKNPGAEPDAAALERLL